MPYRPPQRPSPVSPTTGLDIARTAGCRIVVTDFSEGNAAYAWREDTIYLSPEIARGTDMLSLLIAAEEVAHAQQPRWWHRMRFFHPLRWLAEADAFLRVKEWMAEMRARS